MGYFVWDESLTTGSDIVDMQHRRIVKYMNELYEAMGHDDRGAISDILYQLDDYTRNYFSFEEEMMESVSYGLTEAHRAIHQSFGALVHDYSVRADRGEDIAKKLLSDLFIWLTNHINIQDRHFATYMKAHVSRNRGKSWLSRALGL